MKRLSLTLGLFGLLGVACQGTARPEGKSADLDEAPALREQAPSSAGRGPAGFSMGVPARQAAPAAVPAPTSVPADRSSNPASAASSLKLIWTASLQVEVPDFKKAADEAGQAAAAVGGYVSDRQSSEDGAGRHRGTITLRVPSDRFSGAISVLERLGKVRNEGIQTQDVTKEYADLETRLKVKRETAARLREILVRQTGKVSEVLEVEREIARVVEEIERAEGQRRYYDNLVALSTISLSLYEPASIVSPGALDPLFSAFRQSARTASESVAAMVLLGSALLPWLIALYLVYRFAPWGRLRRRRTPSAPPTDPAR